MAEIATPLRRRKVIKNQIKKMKETINKILDSKVPIIIIGIIALIFFSYKNIRYYYHLGNYSEETVARVFDVSRSGNAGYLDYTIYELGIGQRCCADL